MEEASRRQAAERAKNEVAERAALKARYAKIRKKLKGDRVKVFDQKGEPDDFTGALESAPVWSYLTLQTQLAPASSKPSA